MVPNLEVLMAFLYSQECYSSPLLCISFRMCSGDIVDKSPFGFQPFLISSSLGNTPEGEDGANSGL